MFKKMLFLLIIFPYFIFGNIAKKSILSVDYQNKEVELLSLVYHENEIEDRISLKFSSNPECVYAPTKEMVKKDSNSYKNGMKILRYFLKAKFNKKTKKLCEDNSIKKDNYTFLMEYDHKKGGILVKIMFDDQQIGFQCESFPSIKQDPTISFVFVKRAVLAAISRNSKNICNTAFFGKKKMKL